MAYYPPINFASYTLTSAGSGLTDTDTTITVNEDISATPTQGYLTIDAGTPASREIVKWTSRNTSSRQFTVVRGQDGTTAVAHLKTATVWITGNAAYFSDLKTYVDASFASPPSAIGSGTPVAGTFTTITATNFTLTSTLKSTASVAFDTDRTVGTSEVNIGYRSVAAVGSAASSVSGSLNQATYTAGGSGDFLGSETQVILNGGAVTNASHFISSSNVISGTLTNRYVIYEQTSSGTNQYFLKTDYAITTGIFSNSTAHVTKAGEIKMVANGTTYYIPIYT